MRGFQQLIEKDWIGMFNEHELQQVRLLEHSAGGVLIQELPWKNFPSWVLDPSF
ncbi:unnamed protein product [Camellia sinensis]